MPPDGGPEDGEWRLGGGRKRGPSNSCGGMYISIIIYVLDMVYNIYIIIINYIYIDESTVHD